ncbi:MAG: hypothetical protein R3F59_26835 [Myxococcota bacterium]
MQLAPWTLLAALLTAPASAVPPGFTHATYVGVTATARTGAVGLPTLNADCAALYTRARMCRDTEILSSFPSPVPGVDARLIATEDHRTSDDLHAVTPYGLVLDVTNLGNGPNCSDSSGLFTALGGISGIQGVMLAADGNLAPATCNTSLVTACCAP